MQKRNNKKRTDGRVSKRTRSPVNYYELEQAPEGYENMFSSSEDEISDGIPLTDEEDDRQRHKTAPRYNENDDENSEYDSEDESEWTRGPLPQIEQERTELGIPDPRSSCYGCTHAGEHNMPSVNVAAVNNLLHFIAKSIGKIDPIAMAKQAEKMHEETIRVPGNKALRKGQTPIPRWTAATILDHMRYHNIDPELAIANDLARLKQWETWVESGLVRRHKRKRTETGDPVIKVDGENMKLLLQIMDKRYKIYNVKPKTCVFSSEGSFVVHDSSNSSPWIQGSRRFFSALVGKSG